MINQEGDVINLFTVPLEIVSQSAVETITLPTNIIIRPDGTLEFLNDSGIPEISEIVIQQHPFAVTTDPNSTDNISPVSTETRQPAETTKLNRNSGKICYLKCKPQKIPLLKRTQKKPKITAANPIKCYLCDAKFVKISQYRLHMQVHMNTKRFSCEHCSEGFNKENNYKVHMVIHSKGPPCCPICQKKFQRMASLKAHLCRHQEEETYVCNECFAEFDGEQEWNNHLQTHEKPDMPALGNNLPYVCSYCHYEFEEEMKYREHISLHLKARRLLADSKRFRNRNVVKRKEFVHKCDVCDKSFPKICLLERHRRIHTGEKPFVCNICNKGFSQNGTLKIHLNKHVGAKPHGCMFCSAKFSQRGNLRVHLEKTHSVAGPADKLYKCSHCTCVFKKISTLNGHVTKVHSMDERGEIASIISQLKELDQSAAQIKSKAPSSVPEAAAKDGSGADNRHHEAYIKLTEATSEDGNIRKYLIRQRASGDSRWYICNYCSKEFKKPSDLIRHIRTHTKEKPFTCTLCDQTFAQKYSLKNHLDVHNRQEYECATCLTKFTSVRALNVHLRKHDKSAEATKSHSYKCSTCRQTFATLDGVTEHMSVHDDVIAESVVLINDINITMKEPMVETEKGLLSIEPAKPKTPLITLEQYKNRPFKCHLCDAAFSKDPHLQRHMNIHTRTRNFKCDHCPKSFSTQYGLKEHVNFHTKTKNHECKICRKRFYTNSVLKRHLAMHSPQKPFICPYCKKRFKLAQFCRKHIKLIHKRNIKEALISNTDPSELLMYADTAEVNPVEESGITISQAYNNISNLITSEREIDTLQEETPHQQNSIANFIVSDNTADYQAESVPVDGANIENAENTVNYPTIFISSEDLQLLSGSNVVSTLIPQLKHPNTDPLILTSINDLQESTNTLYPLDPALPAQAETGFGSEAAATFDGFAPNLIFNANDLHVSSAAKKNDKAVYASEHIDLELNKIASEKLVGDVSDNLITFNAGPSRSGALSYFNIHFDQSDFLDGHAADKDGKDGAGDVLSGLFKSLHDAGEHGNGVVERVENENTAINLEETACGNNELGIKTKDDRVADNDEGIPTEEFKCPYCDKTFPQQNRLVRHISGKHKDEKEPVIYSCEFCAKQFKKNCDLVRHLRTHTGERPFVCTKCNKGFSLKSTLQSHLRTHDANIKKEFLCEVCNTYFSCKSSLKTHTLLHTDIRPYACDICPDTFRTAAHRASHMKGHQKKAKSKVSVKVNSLNLLKSFLMESANGIQTSGGHGDETGGDRIWLPDTQDEIQQATQHLITNELPAAEHIDLSEPVEIDPLLLQLQNSYLTIAPQVEIDGQLINIRSDLNIDVLNSDILTKPDEVKAAAKPSQYTIKEKKFQCDICSKFYISKSVLRKHQKLLHTVKNGSQEGSGETEGGSRPYPCYLCLNSFAEEGSLKTHLKRIHKVVVTAHNFVQNGIVLD